MSDPGDGASPDGSADEPSAPPPPPPVPPSAPPYGQVPTESTATGALVVSIVGLVMAFLVPIGGVALGVVGLVLANMSNKKIAASNGALTGESLVRIARVTSIIAIVAAVIIVILVTIAVNNRNN